VISPDTRPAQFVAKFGNQDLHLMQLADAGDNERRPANCFSLLWQFLCIYWYNEMNYAK
jgi:hypothetical protein